MIQKKISLAINVYYSVPFLVTVLVLLILSSCQQESEEIVPFPPDKVIIPGSSVANLISRVALSDGSADNIIDNSSCVSLVLPVTVLANNQEIKITSPDDFKFVERIFDDSAIDDDTLTLFFPVTIIHADYTQSIIKNEAELEAIIDQCTENGDHDDIECIDFEYPLTLSVYDTDTQLSKTVTINKDEELYEFFDALKKSELVGFKFPITVVLPGNVKITIQNNIELEDVIESTIGKCDEDDDNDYNDDDIDDSALMAALVNGTWKIKSYVDVSDLTTKFTNYIFTFNVDGSAVANDATASVNGNWKTYGDNGLELDLDFADDTLLDELNEDWEIVEFTPDIIKLKHVDNVDEAVRSLVFEKK